MLQIHAKLEDIRGSNSKKIVERAPSCSKMLQITRKMDRIGNPKMGGKKIRTPYFSPFKPPFGVYYSRVDSKISSR